MEQDACDICVTRNNGKSPTDYRVRRCAACGYRLLDHRWSVHPHVGLGILCNGYTEELDESFED